MSRTKPSLISAFCGADSVLAGGVAGLAGMSPIVPLDGPKKTKPPEGGFVLMCDVSEIQIQNL